MAKQKTATKLDFTGFVTVFTLSNCQRWDCIILECRFQATALFLCPFSERRYNMRLPNSYGSVTKLSGNRRKPYMVRITAEPEYDEQKEDFL